ncbi:hypothetical protein [Parabacteroides sp. ZJ-118]
MICNFVRLCLDAYEAVSKIEDYHSHNTHRLDVEGMTIN